jgi:hypothetical protein
MPTKVNGFWSRIEAIKATYRPSSGVERRGPTVSSYPTSTLKTNVPDRTHQRLELSNVRSVRKAI